MTSDANRENHTLLPPSDLWRQLLIYPSIGTSRRGVFLSKGASSGIVWIELNTRKVWGFVIKGGNFLISFSELEHIAQLLESCHPKEFDEILQRIGLLTGRTTAKAPSATERKTLSRSLVDSWLATRWRKVPDEVQAICRQEVVPHIEADLLTGLKQFHAGLDQEALAVSGCILLEDAADIIRYDYFIHANPNVQRNRRQAARVFPWLADMFSQISEQHEIYLNRE